MRAVAINVGANTNEPGFRGPVDADGRFTFLPIPETKPTVEAVPTYGDLDARLDWSIPDSVHDTPVHLDPEFADYPCGQSYTYGDDHGVKAGPLAALSAGDFVFFYATLSVTDSAAWLPPVWGAFLIGQFRLASDPLTPHEDGLSDTDRARFATNAHLKRDPVDARVLLRGDSKESRLYDRAIPLSTPSGGVDAGWVVTDLSSDSGRGPWWRRPLRFDEQATERVRALTAVPPAEALDPDGI